MEKRVIGKSGIEAGGLSLGCWAIGGEWWGENDDRFRDAGRHCVSETAWFDP